MIWRKDPTHRIHRANPILPPSGVEAAARKHLDELALKVQQDTAFILDWLKEGKIGRLVIANALEDQLQKWEYVNVSNFAAGWVLSVDKVVKSQLTSRVQTAFRGRAVQLLDNDQLLAAVQASASDIAGKIRDVPRAYIGNVARAAVQKFSGKPFPEGRSLTQQLMHINNENYERAKFIARQTNGVITTQINKERQTSLGIEEYYWSSANDERTVGKPGGRYQAVTEKQKKAHGNHWERDYRNNGGVAYRWDTPFEDGLPRDAFRCRCTALAKIDTAKLDQSKVILLDHPNQRMGAALFVENPSIPGIIAA